MTTRWSESDLKAHQKRIAKAPAQRLADVQATVRQQQYYARELAAWKAYLQEEKAAYRACVQADFDEPPGVWRGTADGNSDRV